MTPRPEITEALSKYARAAFHPDPIIGELRRDVARLELELAMARHHLRLAEEKADRE